MVAPAHTGGDLIDSVERIWYNRSRNICMWPCEPWSLLGSLHRGFSWGWSAVRRRTALYGKRRSRSNSGLRRSPLGEKNHGIPAKKNFSMTTNCAEKRRVWICCATNGAFSAQETLAPVFAPKERVSGAVSGLVINGRIAPAKAFPLW
jgi:hypothetical protein